MGLRASRRRRSSRASPVCNASRSAKRPPAIPRDRGASSLAKQVAGLTARRSAHGARRTALGAPRARRTLGARESRITVRIDTVTSLSRKASVPRVVACAVRGAAAAAGSTSLELPPRTVSRRARSRESKPKFD